MIARTTEQDSARSVQMHDFDWRLAMPVILLLVTQVGLYCWMAPRGFEFTDEAYYLLNYLYWRELFGSMTLFGAYFELPFRLLGQSVPAIRVFGLVALLASSAFFVREAMAYAARTNDLAGKTPLAFVVVGMTASLFYFGPLTTLRAPSYNLLVLVSMLLASGLLLRLLARSAPPAHARVSMFCYGLALAAGALGKVSSGGLLVACHALFFLFFNRDWRLRNLLELLILSLAGVGLSFALLQMAHPQWLSALREGLALKNGSDGGNVLLLTNSLRWDIQTQLRGFLPWAAGIAVLFVLLVRWIGTSRRGVLSALVFALVGACVLGLIFAPARWWLLLLGLATLLLWSVDWINRKPLRLTRGDARDFGLMALLFAMPIVYSFGTNLAVLEHSEMAAVFVVTALAIRLDRLGRLNLLAFPALALCLTVLCMPTLVIQFRAATDVEFTYRQLSALADQSLPVRVGSGDQELLVDATTRESLQATIGAARAAGFVPGQLILDLTGDGPGLVYALAGRPLGSAWLFGGYPGSEAMAERLIARLSVPELQGAWLLTSDDNPRAIHGWQGLLRARLGEDSHEHAASVTIRAPYGWGTNAPEFITLKFWRPRPQAFDKASSGGADLASPQRVGP